MAIQKLREEFPEAPQPRLSWRVVGIGAIAAGVITTLFSIVTTGDIPFVGKNMHVDLIALVEQPKSVPQPVLPQ